MSKQDQNGRNTVLTSIRKALANYPLPPASAPSPHHTASRKKYSVEDFRQRLLDSKATVAEANTLQEVPDRVSEYCKSQKLCLDIAVAPGKLVNLPWQKAGLKTKGQWDEQLSLAVTACRGAIAETGQFLVANDTPEAWLSLVATVHVVVIDLANLHNSLDDLGDLLGTKLPSTVTLVHGPSCTADIEQTLIMGAHGPSKVHAIVVAGKLVPRQKTVKKQ